MTSQNLVQWRAELRKSFGLISRHYTLEAAIKAKARNEAETKRYQAEAKANPSKRKSGTFNVWLDEPTILVDLEPTP